MIILKEVKHHQPTNSVEATWVERTEIVTQIPDPNWKQRIIVVDGEMQLDPTDIQPMVSRAEVVDVQVKCHSYADVQMDMLEADIAVLGGNLAEHAALIATVRANVKPPVPEPVVVPQVVTMRQARLALLQTGMLASVNAAVAAADEATKITWEFSSEVQRSNPLVSTLAAALNLTDAQLDDLFTLAATL